MNQGFIPGFLLNNKKTTVKIDSCKKQLRKAEHLLE